MQHYGIEVNAERRSTLPVWDIEYEGKFIYSEAADTLYYGSDVSWVTVSGGGGTSIHSVLVGLDYASAGHTGFAEFSHTHDDRYYTESEVDGLLTTISGKLDDHDELNNLDYASSGHIGFASDADLTTVSGSVADNTALIGTTSGTLQTNIDGKSDLGHDHTESDIIDLDKYTQVEVDTISGSLSAEIDSDISTHSSSGDHDDRYYTESEADIISGALQANIDGKADTVHTHDDRYYTEIEVDTISGSLSTEIDSNISIHSSSADHDGRYYTEVEVTTISGNIVSQIPSDFYSQTEVITISGVLQDNIDGKSDTSHTHDDRYYTETELDAGQLDDQYYTESEVDAISGSLQTNIDGKSDTSHLHDDRYYTESEVDDMITTMSGNLDDHNELNNLDYASSGHTGFQISGDYITDAELTTISGDLQTNIDSKSNTDHLHDDRYYTESEVDVISGSLSSEIDSDISTHNSDTTDIHGIADTSDLALKSGNVNQFADITSTGTDIEDAVTKKHTESHTITSHSDITDATGAQIEELTGAGNTTLHKHDTLYYTESEVDAISGSLQTNIDGKSDTSHLHDDRYYTESEVNTISGSLNTKVGSKAGLGVNADITSMTGLDDDGIPGAKVVASTKTTEGVIEIATNAEIAAFTDENRAITPEGLGYAMAGALAYGVEWDEDDPSPILTRLGTLANSASAVSPGNALLPIQSQMRRCILNDAGVVQYYLAATDSTLKVNGTAANLDGTDGQVMVPIPKFAYKYTYNADLHQHQWWISPVLLPGFEWHPAFYKNGAWVDYRYIGAYEGIGYDDSTSAYFDGDDVGDSPTTNWPGGTAIDLANDGLGSVSGFAPLVNETRAEFRSICSNRGTGWRQKDFYLVSAIQLLHFVEYASFNSQSMIGMGRTERTGTWEKDSYIGVTGKSNSLGNATGNVGGNTNDAFMSYRGIENFFGNVWKWVDGFNINSGIPYVSNVDTDFADDTATGVGGTYARLLDINGDGIELPQGSNDWQSTLEQIKGGFLPSALGGSSSTYITDYYYQYSGWRVAALGGNANDGLKAGVACWGLADSSADVHVNVAARLCR